MPERNEQKKLRFLLKGYDEVAQVNEINNVLLLIRRVVDDAQRRSARNLLIVYMLISLMKTKRKLFDDPELDRLVKEARRRDIFGKAKL